jgi:hypothetical protein
VGRFRGAHLGTGYTPTLKTTTTELEGMAAANWPEAGKPAWEVFSTGSVRVSTINTPFTTSQWLMIYNIKPLPAEAITVTGVGFGSAARLAWGGGTPTGTGEIGRAAITAGITAAPQGSTSLGAFIPYGYGPTLWVPPPQTLHPVNIAAASWNGGGHFAFNITASQGPEYTVFGTGEAQTAQHVLIRYTYMG